MRGLIPPFLGSSLLWLMLFCLPIAQADEPVSRSKAAAIALAAFGGKVLSVEDVEKDPQPLEGEAANIQSNARYEVKLLQSGGRVKVVHLDEFGHIL